MRRFEITKINIYRNNKLELGKFYLQRERVGDREIHTTWVCLILTKVRRVTKLAANNGLVLNEE